MREREIRTGDWVRINKPELPWFHDQIAEVLWSKGYGECDARPVHLAVNGHTSTTGWTLDEVILLDDEYERAVETFGEDYFK